MTLIIEITSELEYQIKQAADKVGLAPDTYILQILHESLQQQAPQKNVGNQLPKEEADLIQIINQSLSDIEWQRYQVLIEKRNAETLTPDEHEELINVSEQLENANTNRIQALVKLAKLRHMSIDALMAELDLKPLAHG